MPQTEAEKKAKAKYQKGTGKEKATAWSYRNKGKNFILKYATLEDLDYYENLIAERKETLKNK